MLLHVKREPLPDRGVPADSNTKLAEFRRHVKFEELLPPLPGAMRRLNGNIALVFSMHSAAAIAPIRR